MIESRATPQSGSVLLTADDLAVRWRISVAHVYRLTRERALPVVRLGRYYRYRLSTIEAWETAQEAATHEQ